jgi:hypothetical protein
MCKKVVIMAKIYAELIKKGIKTLEEVPEKLRKRVQEILEEGDNW